MTRLVLATRNPGKVAEFRRLLAGLDLELVSLADFPDLAEPEESGGTFAENALIKARAAAVGTGLPALADDSGLEVDALDGRPGVHSARYGGPGLTDADRNGLLLKQLRDVPLKGRTARYRAVLALAWPGGEQRLFEGTVEGWIGFRPRGRGGFGYDPLFCLVDARGRLLDRTMAEITAAEKDALSHRGRAARRLREALAAGEIVL